MTVTLVNFGSTDYTKALRETRLFHSTDIYPLQYLLNYIPKITAYISGKQRISGFCVICLEEKPV